MKKVIIISIIFSFFMSYSLHGRSVHRASQMKLPCIEVQWLDDNKERYSIRDSHLEPYPLLTINAHDCHQYTLNKQTIEYYDQGTQTVDGTLLNTCIENLLTEIKQHKSTFTDFTVLHQGNFNYKKLCGLLILKFNRYPLVLKLFFETPQTFVNPYCKGFFPIWFFFMSGGANRHIAGLTRIKNRNLVHDMIAHHPYWSDCVIVPRKWFWMPQENRWIKLTGTNIGTKKEITNVLPSVFGIVADWVPVDHTCSLSQQEKDRLALQLCCDLNLMIDPHASNFIFSHGNSPDKPTIAIIDTEHFPTIVGIKEYKQPFTNYNSWYSYLTQKCFNDIYLRTKRERMLAQTRERISPYALA